MNLWPFKKKQVTPATHRYSELRITLQGGGWVSCDTPLEDTQGADVWREFYTWYEHAGLDDTHVVVVHDGAIGVARRDIRHVFVREEWK